MADYYDYVLGVVPLSMVSVTALLAVVGVQIAIAVPVGAAASAAVIGHALFVNGPVAPTPADAPARPGTGTAGTGAGLATPAPGDD
jgi:hypothetical protein